jgi:hypothetical protein
MTRDKEIYARALRLMELLGRRLRTGRITSAAFRSRENTLINAHYRAQHRAGATDYPKGGI